MDAELHTLLSFINILILARQSHSLKVFWYNRRASHKASLYSAYLLYSSHFPKLFISAELLSGS
jgi:hypothetical protein